jgi:hypothetical protein
MFSFNTKNNNNFICKDYSLHGISPFYDQTTFVRCHLCPNIVKLPQLAEHLGKQKL